MNQIETQMNKLRLHGMTKSWNSLQETRQLHELSLMEGMELLLQAEEQERNDRWFSRLEYSAGFRYKASIEEIKTDPTRGIDKSLLALLTTGEYISKGLSVLVVGKTGVGKSFLSSALGHQACLQGYKVAYFNIQKLMVKTKMARVDGTIYKFFEKLAKTNLLILDDFGLTSFGKQQMMDLMEIIEDRHGKNSTIIASQLPIANWYDVLSEQATAADAILDRLLHSSYRVEIKGYDNNMVMESPLQSVLIHNALHNNFTFGLYIIIISYLIL